MSSEYEVHIPMGGGGGGPPPPGSLDRFAPTYLVGNVPAGDSPVPYSSGGFNYVPDTGNGAGLAAALAAAAANTGRVYFRRGTYDFGAAGAPATPVTVPVAVNLQGEGHASLLRGASTGEGVLVALLGSSLSDFDVENNASTGPSLATALVRCVDGVAVENVTIRCTTSDTEGASLREGIRFDGAGTNPGQVHTARNLFVSMFTTTQDLASACIAIGATIFIGQTVETLGGNIGMTVADGSILVDGLIQFNWLNQGLLCLTSQCTVRAYNVVQFSTGTDPTARGTVLRGSGHTIRAGIIQSPGPTPLAVGIELVDPDGNGTSGNEIEGFIIQGVDRGILGGKLTVPRMSVNDTAITGCSIQANVSGIEFLNSQNNDILIDGNTVNVNASGFPLGGTAGIHFQGIVSRIVNNQVSLNFQGEGTAPSVHAIWVDGIDYGPADPNNTQLNQVEGNNCNVGAAGYCIEVSGERCVVTGNITQASGDSLGCIHLGGKVVAEVFQGVVRCIVGDNDCTFGTSAIPGPLPAAIVAEGQLCTINSNAIFTSAAGPTAGIVLTATSANNVCIGNTSEGTPGTPVANLGVGNETAHNIGV